MHTFNPLAWKVTEFKVSLIIQLVLGQPGLRRETLSQKQKTTKGVGGEERDREGGRRRKKKYMWQKAPEASRAAESSVCHVCCDTEELSCVLSLLVVVRP